MSGVTIGAVGNLTEICYNFAMKDTRQEANDTKVKPIMAFRQSLFWDVDPKTIDPEKNSAYIIERILDFGEPKEARWLFERYPKSEIKMVMDRPRSQVLAKSKALWSLILA